MTELFIKTVLVDTTTLASLTAFAADESLSDFKEALLLTKAMTEVLGDWPNTTTDMLLLCLVYGDATLAQVAEAFSGQSADIEDGVTWRIDQTKARVIIDFVALRPADTAGNVMAQSVEWRLPKGGLPSAKGNGFKLVFFNPQNIALANGPKIVSTTKWYLQRLGS